MSLLVLYSLLLWSHSGFLRPVFRISAPTKLAPASRILRPVLRIVATACSVLRPTRRKLAPAKRKGGQFHYADLQTLNVKQIDGLIVRTSKQFLNKFENSSFRIMTQFLTFEEIIKKAIPNVFRHKESIAKHFDLMGGNIHKQKFYSDEKEIRAFFFNYST